MFSKDNHEAHLSDEQLLLYLDGELPEESSQQVRMHLESCWSCRLHQEQMQEGISAAVTFRERALWTRPIPPSAGRQLLLARIREISKQRASQKESRLFAERWVASILAWNALRPLAGIALVAVTLIVGSLFLKRTVAPVSGTQLLAQAHEADKALATPASHLVHRTITLEERDPLTAEIVRKQKIEIWEAPDNRSARRVYASDGRLVAGEWLKRDGSRVTFQQAKLRSVGRPDSLSDDGIWQLTPSAEVFAGLTGHSQKLTVEETPAVYILRYKSEKSSATRLLNASLTLRRPDLHVIEQSLQLQTNGKVKDYRFVETQLEQKPVTSILASVLDVDPGLVTTPVHAEVLQPEQMLEQSFAATPDLKVEALDRLDRAGALIEGQVNVRLTGGTLNIEGAVQDEQRKTELIGALGDLARNPAVQVGIATPDEIQPDSNQRPQRVIVQAVEAQEAFAGSVPVREYIESTTQLRGEALNQEVTRFSESVLKYSADAQLHAMVLRQLAETLPAGDLANLSPRAEGEWKSLVNRHAEQLRADLAQIEKTIRPVFGPGSDARLPLGNEADLNSSLVLTAKLTSDVNHAIGQTLAISTHTTEGPTLASAQFWKTLNTAHALASAIVRRTKP